MKHMFTIRMLDPEGNVLHERVSDDPVWYLANMINWEAVKTGEHIDIRVNDPQDGYSQTTNILGPGGFYYPPCPECGQAQAKGHMAEAHGEKE
jgi:hypothetical protein